jgi:hypothetical protein
MRRQVLAGLVCATLRINHFQGIVQQMILNDMGMNLLVDAPPPKVTERKHADNKPGPRFRGLAARFSDVVNERNR